MKKSLAVLIAAGVLTVLSATPLICDDQMLPVHSVPAPKPAQSPGTQQQEFHGEGQVQRVGKDEVGVPIIVIDDRLKYFAKNVTFFDMEGNPLRFSSFHAGNTVGYMLNAESQITSLHLLQK